MVQVNIPKLQTTKSSGGAYLITSIYTKLRNICNKKSGLVNQSTTSLTEYQELYTLSRLFNEIIEV